MSNILRHALLGLFASAGVAAAVWIAMGTGPTAGSASDDSENAVSASRSFRVAKRGSLRSGPQATHPYWDVGDEDSGDSPRLSGLQTIPIRPPVSQVPAGPPPQLPPHPTNDADVLEQILSTLKAAQSGKNTGGAQLPPGEVAPNVFANPGPSAPVNPLPPPNDGNGQAGNSGNASPPATRPTITRSGDGNDKLSITIQGADLREVLEMISEQGDLNILTSNNVGGKVSATLKGVGIEQALDAILKSTGYIWRREGNFIYVGTPQDFAAMRQAHDRLGTRLYQPNYVRAEDLKTLIVPLLTPGVGLVSVTSPSEVGIAPDGNNAGGDNYAGQEVLLVRDYEDALKQVDQVVTQVDRRPTQVAIEAMILSVKIDDRNELGVDFAALRNSGTIRVVSGNPMTSLAQVNPGDGLKVGFLDSSLSVFLKALETIGDTNVIATPRLMCLNKHRAEILIGAQLGYVSTTQTETSTTQSVEFLEIGTQLRLRPFISSDGMIRMEVHPELSTGTVRVEEGFTLPDKEVTQVTTNVMVADGSTMILGGLMRDELTQNATQIPYFGSLPVVGPVFRQNVEKVERREVLVLVTPRIIYEPEICEEGNKGAAEFHQRHSVYADEMIPFGRIYVGRKYFRLAQIAWSRGNQAEALRLVNLAIHFDPSSRAAINLRSDIWEGAAEGDHTLDTPPMVVPLLPDSQLPEGAELVAPLDAASLPPGMRPYGPPPYGGPRHPIEPGRPGDIQKIRNPGDKR